MLPRKNRSLFTLALLSALVAAPASIFFTAHTTLAQTSSPSPSFPLPKVVPTGSRVRIDGSDSMEVINQYLKQRYEKEFTGTQVELSVNGTRAALQAVLAGKIDLAAIGRSLTPAERAQGLVQVPVSREKIAIVVGAENPFKGNITDDQFARIFRGEITDWSQLGGTAGRIRFIDRPADSDTRQAFQNYPVFKKGKFATGATATTIGQDSTADMIQQLGRDGIGYAIYSQVKSAKNVRILSMHKTLPDDPRYPFSQPRVYVYKTTPTPPAKDFLGYATAPVGQQAVEAAKTAEAKAVASGQDPTTAATTPPSPAASVFPEDSLVSASGLLAFSPDGKTVIRSAEDGALQFFNAEGEPIGKTFRGVGQPVSFGFSPDGKTIAVGNTNGAIQRFDLEGNSVGQPIKELTQAVTSLAFSPDGQTIVAGGDKGAVQLFNLQGKPLGKSFKGVSAVATALAFSPNGKEIAIGGDNGTINFVNLQGQPIEKGITWINSPITALAFNPDGRVIAVSDATGTLRLLDTNGKNIEPPFSLGEPTGALAFSSTGQTIISAGKDGRLKAWNLQGQSIALGSNVDALGSIPAWLWWLLLPLGLLALLLWWWSRKDRSEPSAEDGTTESDNLLTGDTAQVVAVPEDVTVSTAAGLTKDPLSGEGTIPSEESVTIGEIEATVPPVAESSQPAESTTSPSTTLADELATGAALAGSGRHEEALVHFDRAIDQDPYSFEAWSAQGDALLHLGQPAEAFNSFDRALEIASSKPMEQLTVAAPVAVGTALLAKTWLGKGSALMRLGRAEEALATFDQAIELKPDYAEAWSSRGNVLMALGRRDEARASFERVAQLQVQDPQASAATETTSDGGQAGAALGGAIAAGAGVAAFAALASDDSQTGVEATKFEVGQRDRTGGTLADVDQGLPDLPDGYGESRIVLMPRDPQWAYAYWDVTNEHKEELRRQGGSRLALRFYDVTDIDINHQKPHSLQQYDCEEFARSWYIPVPVSDRDYMVEIGYVANNGGWLLLARSLPIRIPPVYPSDWFDDQFMTVSWDEDLRGKTLLSLVPPSQRTTSDNAIYTQIFDLAQSAEIQRVAGSLFGSMQHVPGSAVPFQPISSYVFPSGVGMGAVPTMSGLTMSGVGFSASAAPIRPRKFWLVADAELIVYGATEPDATVTVGGRPVQLTPDGTFRFQMSFQDGLIDFPIMAVASDGEQNRAIHMKFTRETPERRTNTKDEAVDEWLP
jgi:ABC-type phosphate transport system substrate-binding protein/Tfp pilus assembly protein PilF